MREVEPARCRRRLQGVVLSMSVLSVHRPATGGRRSIFPAVAAIIVVLAVVALYSIRPVGTTTTASGPSEFATGYAKAVAEFQSATKALQTEAEQVSGAGTDQILPIYVRLR